jgi:hypothetical protein
LRARALRRAKVAPLHAKRSSPPFRGLPSGTRNIRRANRKFVNYAIIPSRSRVLFIPTRVDPFPAEHSFIALNNHTHSFIALTYFIKHLARLTLTWQFIHASSSTFHNSSPSYSKNSPTMTCSLSIIFPTYKFSFASIYISLGRSLRLSHFFASKTSDHSL